MLNKFNPDKTRQLNKINKLLMLFFHTRKSKNEIVWNQVKRILIVDMTLIGDTIMLLPFLKVLAQNAVNAEIDLVCGSWGKELLNEQELVKEFFLLPGSKIESPKAIVKNWAEVKRTIKDIRKTNYDLIIEPRGDLRYIFFMYWCKGTRKISYNYTGGESMLTDVIAPGEHIKHLIDDKLYLLGKLGCIFEQTDRIPRMKIGKEFDEYRRCFRIENSIEGATVVGIHPGSSLAIKEWDKYPDLLIRINQKWNNLFFVIFVGPGEEECANNVVAAAESVGVRYILSNTGFKEYIRRLYVCDYIICNDSGAGHIGAALDKNIVCIMGPFQPEYCGPVGGNVSTVSHNMDCKPCLSRECRLGNRNCISSISVDEVIDKIRM